MRANVRERLAGLGVAAGLCLAACGGKDNPILTDKAAPTDASPPVLASPRADPRLPDVTFSMTGHVDAGGEALSCVYVAMPTDRGLIAVPSAESHYTPGSHHFLVYRTTYDVVPNGGGNAHPCTDLEQIANVAGSYYEAQVPDARRDLPEGVAHVFRPGEVLLLTAHYLNSTSKGYDTRVDLRMHTMDLADVENEAGSIFFYNPFISIPPSSLVTVTRVCPISQDINVALLWSHMHSRGIEFRAVSDDAVAAERLGDLYASTSWNEPEPRTFPVDPPATLHAGSVIAYACSYNNTTSATIVAGQSAATNEMCILHGMYWPRADSDTETCGSGLSSSGPGSL